MAERRDDVSDAPTRTETATASAIDPAHAPTEVLTPGERAITLAIGQRLGDRYLVRAFLGEGGMGAVYRALDEELDVDVALKVVRGAVGEHSSLRDEVRLAQKVTHGNVCRTYDLETVGDHQFVKMEYVAGETLARRLSHGGALRIEEAIRIARAIADGLAAAHAVGIVHRDLKPGNVMLGAHDRVVLMDFGLALQGHDAAGADTSGTPGYMSPEQLAGRGVDATSDLYALGCLAYEMLTGERVFGSGTAIELAARHASQRAADVRTRRRDVPRWLARAVAKLLSKRPADRRAGASMLAAGPRRGMAIAIGVVGAAALGGLVVWSLRTTPWQADVHPLEPKFHENANAPAISRDGQWIIYPGDRGRSDRFTLFVVPTAGGEATVVSPDVDAVFVRWSRDGKSVVFSDSRQFVFRQQMRLEPGQRPVAVGLPEHLAVGEDPDDCGDSLVFVDRGRLVRRTPDGVERVLVPRGSGEEIGHPRCAPDGDRVVFWRGQIITGFAGADIVVVDRAGVMQELTTDHRSTMPVFTPDGRSVVFSSRRDGKVNLYEVPITGGNAHRLTTGLGPDLGADITPDGTTLVFDYDTTAKGLRRHTRDDEGLEVTHRIENLEHPIPLPDDTVLAVRADPEGDMIVVISADGSERDLGPGQAPFASLVGGRAVFRSRDNPRLLLAIDLATNTTTTIAELPGPILCGTDGPDGIHLAIVVDNVVKGWRVVDGQPVSEGIDGLVLPAPHGGWRAIVSLTEVGFIISMVAPGGPLVILTSPKVPGTRTVEAVPDDPSFDGRLSRVTWLDDDRIAYFGRTGFSILSKDGRLLDHFDATRGQIARDGEHWYETRESGQVERHAIRNFATRPWKP